MSAPTVAQLDYILRLANQLTGERVRYLSQSSVVSSPKTGPEASVLIDDLKAAIEEEEDRCERTGFVPDARVTFAYTWKDGSTTQVTGTIDGYRWSGLRVMSVWLRDLDDATRERGKDRALFALARAANRTLVTEDEPPMATAQVTIDMTADLQLPARGTPDWDVWIAAIEVATNAPLSHGPTTTHAKIYWPKIEQLRTALENAGIDWRKAKAQ